MGNTDYSAFTQPTSQLASDVLSHWQEIKEQTGGDTQLLDSFEQRLCSLTSRVVAIAEIGGQQMPGTFGKQRQSALSGQR